MVFSCFGSIATRLPLCVCAYILGLFSVPLGVPKMSLRPLGNDRFLLCLSLDLDGVPLFPDPLSSGCRCAFVRSRSRHVFC